MDDKLPLLNRIFLAFLIIIGLIIIGTLMVAEFLKIQLFKFIDYIIASLHKSLILLNKIIKKK